MTWRDAPPCRERPGLYYSTEPDDVEAALRICGTCPHVAPCLTEELGHGPSHQWGVRGAMTASERRTLITDLKAAQ